MTTLGRRYQIFISSTYDDLKREREAVIKAVLEIGHIPVGMELFNAADETQWNHIARQIQISDYYVVIVAHRYGSRTDDGLSYTEKEYDYAIAQNVPVLGFIIDNSAPWPQDKIEVQSKADLDSFKSKLQKRIVKYWRQEEDLKSGVITALIYQIEATPRPGWIRSDEAIDPSVANELSLLSEENRNLRDQNQNLTTQLGRRRIPITGAEKKIWRFFAVADSEHFLLSFLETMFHQWTPSKIHYHIDRLMEANLLESEVSLAGPILYSLSADGRRYVWEGGLSRRKVTPNEVVSDGEEGSTVENDE